MSVKQLDVKILSKMFFAGTHYLDAKKEIINELNVFPVPDGDTGSNMTMTLVSAVKEVDALTSPAAMPALCKAISNGSLKGARGNSGVILSQLIRGFTRVVAAHDTINAAVLAESCQRAVDTAYKAVMKPKEGTILTVAKGFSQRLTELVKDGEKDIETLIEKSLEYANDVLAKTPDMLPVLKQAGVVDSGGQGLIEILTGAYDALLGKEIPYDFAKKTAATGSVSPAVDRAAIETAAIRFGYCTEFIILTEGMSVTASQKNDLRTSLEKLGDSLVFVADEDIIKIHVHTNDPGIAIQEALKLGQLSHLKIDNMRLEHQETLFAKEPPSDDSAKKTVVVPAPITKIHKKAAFITVSSGSGFQKIFEGLETDIIIEGGQTMNPSAGDFMTAIESLDADCIYILPNNSNILLAANQAAAVSKTQHVVVIPTKTIPQGITAMISFSIDLTPEENEAVMLQDIARVKTAQITFAVRDSQIDHFDIKAEDIIAVSSSDGLLASGKQITEVCLDATASLVEEDAELISVYYGEGIDEKEAKALADRLEADYPNVDIDLQFGGQPVYYYIISVE